MEELREKIGEAVAEAMENWPGSATRLSPEQYWGNAALRAIEEEGFAVVPKELTEAMKDAASEFPGIAEPNDVEWVWGLMLNAVRPLNLEEPRG